MRHGCMDNMACTQIYNLLYVIATSLHTIALKWLRGSGGFCFTISRFYVCSYLLTEERK